MKFYPIFYCFIYLEKKNTNNTSPKWKGSFFKKKIMKRGLNVHFENIVV